jgi:crotonobetainyl-CoA:carnitine CoA-transferase CaiB-like acyl-CoA transferase
VELANGNRVWAAGRYASFSRTQLTRVTVPPGLGEHTREVLESVGYGDAEINALLAVGTIMQGGPFVV